MDARQQALVAEIVEVLADGLGRDLEAAHEIIDHDAAKGARVIEDFGLAMGKTGRHVSTSWNDSMVLMFAEWVNAPCASDAMRRDVPPRRGTRASYAAVAVSGVPGWTPWAN